MITVVKPNGFSEINSSENCLIKLSPGEVRGEVRPAEVRPVEVRLAEVCLEEVRPAEVQLNPPA